MEGDVVLQRLPHASRGEGERRDLGELLTHSAEDHRCDLDITRQEG